MNLLVFNHLFILADSHHFLLLARDLNKKQLHLKILYQKEFDSEQYESLKRDNPGKTISRARGSHSAYGYENLKIRADNRYLSDACKSIDGIFQEGNFEGLVLIAEPKLIAEIRQHLSHAIKDKIVQEVHKNYAKLPIAELEHQLIHLDSLS